MEKTFKEKVLAKFQKITKKHKVLRVPLAICAAVILGVYNVIAFFTSNGKRFASFAVVLLFFIISSSFSFPGFAEQAAGTEELENAVYRYDSQVKLAQEANVSAEDVEFLEEDELEGYENSEHYGMENADRYTLDDILEENSKYAELSKTEVPEESEEEYHFDKEDWRLILVNKQHPIPDDYEVKLETIKGNMKCDERILGDLIAMFQAAKEDGVTLEVRSPYRDMSRQEWLFGRKIKYYMGKGMSYMEAYTLSSQIVMVPGASEHQLGLALDITSDTYTALDEGFADTEAGKWLAEHCCEYGFVLRYPLGKEYITGVEYEPWHFRYVGKEAATVMTDEGICLEEFMDRL